MTDDEYIKIVKAVLQIKMDDFFKFSFLGKWYPDRTSEYTSGFYNSFGDNLKNLPKKIRDNQDDILHILIDIVRRREDIIKKKKVNSFIFEIFADGHYDARWLYDEKLDERYFAEMREALGEADYKKWRQELDDAERTRASASQSSNAAQPLDEAETAEGASVADESPAQAYTEGQLLGVIADAVRNASPQQCEEFIVDVRVHKTPGQRKELGADFWARLPSGRLTAVTPEDAIAAMNAADLLQGMLFEDEENPKPWHTLRVFCERESGSVELEFDPSQAPD